MSAAAIFELRAAGFGSDQEADQEADHVSGHLSGSAEPIDAASSAEEIDDVGSARYDKLESALPVLLAHISKWDHQPERRSRSRENTIREQGRRVLREPHENGRDRGASGTGMDVEALATIPPDSRDEIMNRDFGRGSTAGTYR